MSMAPPAPPAHPTHVGLPHGWGGVPAAMCPLPRAAAPEPLVGVGTLRALPAPGSVGGTKGDTGD